LNPLSQFHLSNQWNQVTHLKQIETSPISFQIFQTCELWRLFAYCQIQLTLVNELYMVLHHKRMCPYTLRADTINWPQRVYGAQILIMQHDRNTIFAINKYYNTILFCFQNYAFKQITYGSRKHTKKGGQKFIQTLFKYPCNR
jgi:hypothetical protein